MQMKSKSWEFLKREEEEERGERKEKRRKNEKREDRRTEMRSSMVWQAAYTAPFRLNLSAELLVLPVISMLLPTLRLESYCRQTSFFLLLLFLLRKLSLTLPHHRAETQTLSHKTLELVMDFLHLLKGFSPFIREAKAPTHSLPTSCFLVEG